MRNYLAIIAFTTFFLKIFGLRVGAAQVNRTAQTESRCNPVGRIYGNDDPRHPYGSLLCSGEYLNAANGRKIDVFCYPIGSHLNFSGLHIDVASKCGSGHELRVQRACNFKDRSKCHYNKGPGNDGATVVLMSPFGTTLLNRRPFLSWQPVPSATNYVVEVEGVGVSWGKKTTNTSLTYPSDESALQYGNSYRIAVIAERDSTVLGKGTEAVNVLPEEKAKQIQATIEQISHLNLPPDEAAYLDLNVVYTAQGLLNDSISVLEARVKAGSHNPSVYRTLGDRYLQSGFPNLAEPKYEEAVEFAKQMSNIAELEKAEAKLKLLARKSQN